MIDNIVFKKDISDQIWDEYCDTIDNSSFEYHSLVIEYRKEYSKYFVEDSSFVLIINNEILAMVPIFIECVNGSNQISNGNSHGIAPLINTNRSYNNQEKILKKVFEIIHDIAYQKKCSKIMFRLDPLVNPNMNLKIYNYNFLMKYGYENHSISSQIVDLQLDIDELFKDIRKGHKYDINRGNKQYDFQGYDKDNITREIFNVYKEMHHRAAGRKTRSDLTFDLMYQWIKNGLGYLGLAKYEGKYIGSILVAAYKDKAYYASAAEDPNINLPCPNGHMLQWNMIKYLKSHNVKYYELGWQQFSEQPYDKPSEKEISIASYKRGFGGYTVPLFRGVKTL